MTVKEVYFVYYFRRKATYGCYKWEFHKKVKLPICPCIRSWSCMKTWKPSFTLSRPRHNVEMKDQLSAPIILPPLWIGQEAAWTSRNGLDVMANIRIDAPTVSPIVHPLYSLKSSDSKWKLTFELYFEARCYNHRVELCRVTFFPFWYRLQCRERSSVIHCHSVNG
jgi:hypothetical protein